VELDVRATQTGAGLGETAALVDVAGERAHADFLQQGEIGRAHRGDERFLIGEIVDRGQRVVLQPVPHGEIRNDRDPEGAQAGARPDPRQQQQLRRPVGPGGHDHFAVGVNHLGLAARVR
jgi:hypothetical protein